MIHWRPKCELQPHMSPVFVACSSWPTWQTAHYDASGQCWKLSLGLFRAVLMDSTDFHFISAADVLPPLPERETA